VYLGTVYVVAEQPEVRHLPNAPGLDGGAAITLCGWVDVPYDEEARGAVTCGQCQAIVHYCRGLRL
jgi:hypothetical protein